MKLTAIEKRQARDKESLLTQLNKAPIIQVACQKSRVPRSTYYRWRNEDEEFAKLSDKALEDGKAKVNDMAESYLISLIQDKNLSAITFWLRYNHSTYSNKAALSTELIQQISQLMQSPDNVLKVFLVLFGGLAPHQSPRDTAQLVETMVEKVREAEELKLEQKKTELSLRATNVALESIETEL